MRQLSKKSVAKLIPYLNSNYLLRNYMIYYSVDHNSFFGLQLSLGQRHTYATSDHHLHPTETCSFPCQFYIEV